MENIFKGNHKINYLMEKKLIILFIKEYNNKFKKQKTKK